MSALLWASRVVGFPGMIGTWLGFAEQLALVVAGFRLNIYRGARE